jgi:hypothetical protein
MIIEDIILVIFFIFKGLFMVYIYPPKFVCNNLIVNVVVIKG